MLLMTKNKGRPNKYLVIFSISHDTNFLKPKQYLAESCFRTIRPSKPRTSRGLAINGQETSQWAKVAFQSNAGVRPGTKPSRVERGWAEPRRVGPGPDKPSRTKLGQANAEQTRHDPGGPKTAQTTPDKANSPQTKISSAIFVGPWGAGSD